MDDVTTTEPTAVDAASEPASSRRRMLQVLAAGAAGAAAAGVAGVVGAGSAAAADGDPLKLGDSTNTHTSVTIVNYTGATVPASTTIEAGDETAGNNTILTNNFGGQGTALLGVAGSTGNQQIGIIGWSKKPGGTGLIGFTGNAGAYGGEFFGGQAELRLRPGGAAPTTLTNAHQAGELYEDADANLWLCVAAGTPGTWRMLSGPKAAGALTLLPSPARVYDSRTADGPLAGGSSRTVSLAQGTVAGTPTPAVPAGATGALISLTLDATVQSGFLSVFAAGLAYPGTSNANWYTTGQILAVTTVSAVDAAAAVTLNAGGPGRTEVIVDVIGFYA
jgi:hypothetical protein